MFHVAIEDQEHIPPVPLAGSISKGSLLNTWNEILAVNYWPIFSVARDVVMDLPVRAVPPVMNRIAESISALALLGATTFHDLTGRMFQTLITDRKFLATFYTLPESACLLAELAVERLDVDWSDRATIERLRIADFACGTGALLSAAQRAVYRRFRRAGGDDKDLHRALMERVLIGLDIMPAGDPSHLLDAVQRPPLARLREIPNPHDALWHRRRPDAHRRARPSRFRALLLPVRHGRVHGRHGIGQPQ